MYGSRSKISNIIIILRIFNATNSCKNELLEYRLIENFSFLRNNSMIHGESMKPILK